MSHVYRSVVGVVLSSLLFGQSESLAQIAPLPSAGTAQPVSGAAQSAMDQIAALVTEIKALGEQVSQLLQQLSQLQSARPKPPPDGASADAKKQYAQALQAWEAQQAALQKKLDQLRARASELEQGLDQLESQVSSAQRRDLAKQRKVLEEVEQQLARAEESTSAKAKKPMRKPGSLAPSPGVSPP